MFQQQQEILPPQQVLKRSEISENDGPLLPSEKASLKERQQLLSKQQAVLAEEAQAKKKLLSSNIFWRLYGWISGESLNLTEEERLLRNEIQRFYVWIIMSSCFIAGVGGLISLSTNGLLPTAIFLIFATTLIGGLLYFTHRKLLSERTWYRKTIPFAFFIACVVILFFAPSIYIIHGPAALLDIFIVSAVMMKGLVSGPAYWGRFIDNLKKTWKEWKEHRANGGSLLSFVIRDKPFRYFITIGLGILLSIVVFVGKSLEIDEIPHLDIFGFLAFAIPALSGMSSYAGLFYRPVNEEKTWYEKWTVRISGLLVLLLIGIGFIIHGGPIGFIALFAGTGLQTEALFASWTLVPIFLFSAANASMSFGDHLGRSWVYFKYWVGNEEIGEYLKGKWSEYSNGFRYMVIGFVLGGLWFGVPGLSTALIVIPHELGRICFAFIIIPTVFSNIAQRVGASCDKSPEAKTDQQGDEAVVAAANSVGRTSSNTSDASDNQDPLGDKPPAPANGAGYAGLLTNHMPQQPSATTTPLLTAKAETKPVVFGETLISRVVSFGYSRTPAQRSTSSTGTISPVGSLDADAQGVHDPVSLASTNRGGWPSLLLLSMGEA
ncbi:MAG: hypothetical protein K0Q74_270 [Gammaproteobacteria bacterium]|nr:hypothetical protein [Gammaproteobacteria bacterium]